MSSKKIRVKRDKKSAYNIFSREYRKSLRDTKSSLSFELMSKEVGIKWRELSSEQRAEFEEKARIETLAEMKKITAEREAQAQAQAQAKAHLEAQQQKQQQQQQQQLQQQQQQQQQMSFSQSISSPLTASSQMFITQTTSQQSQHTQQQQPQVYILSNGTVQQPLQQQQGNAYIVYQPQPVIQPPVAPTYGPRQVQHKEAYVKYISNIRKQQQLAQSAAYNPVGAALPASDWHKSLDVRMSQIKEKKVMPPPISWIENCGTQDVLKHLASLRFYMLNDAINVTSGHVSEYYYDANNSVLTAVDEEEKEN